MIPMHSLINEAYEKHFQSQPCGNYKVIAGIVMTSGLGNNDGIVVALASGSKGLHVVNLSKEGDVIHDCHAEILAHRAFVYFLYDQMVKCLGSDAMDSIFHVTYSTDGKRTPRFELKYGIKFHLYISSAPCGDGRQFFVPGNVRVKTRVKHGQLRVKVDGGKGIIHNPSYLKL